MIQIPKIIKILISILIAISVAISPFSGMGFNVRSEATGQIIVQGIKWAIIEWLKSVGISISEYTLDYISTTLPAQMLTYQDFFEKQQQSMVNVLSSETGVSLSLTHIHGTDQYLVGAELSADSSSFTEDEQAFATFFVNYINENPTIVQHSAGETFDKLLLDDEISASGYEAVKTVATNAYNCYLLNKMSNELASEELKNALGDTALDLPAYNFDFVGPTPTLELPVLNSYATRDVNGFIFTAPITVTADRCNTSSHNSITLTASEADVLAVPGYINHVKNSSGMSFLSIGHENTVYGYSQYALYNGEIYYYTWGDAYSSSGVYWKPTSFIFSDLYSWRTVDGKTLGDAGIKNSTFTSLQMGFCYNINNSVPYASPYDYSKEVSTDVTVTESDLMSTTGGAVGVPFTAAEQLIGQAQKLGLLSPDSLLTLNESGEIVAGDDISLAKLQELCNLIAEGNLNFEDIQEYLDLITKLVSSGNVTATEQKTILENLQKLEKSKTADLTKIRTAIESISGALTVPEDIKIPTVDLGEKVIAIDGISDAETFVDISFPVIRQAKTLITNLFGWNDSVPEPPNFSFYWDSNKDGETERYTVLDLSFMENTLSNDNLEDKGRFPNPMTVREFIQSLFVLVVYGTFAIKVLKRIPSLLGGSGADGDFDTSVKPTDSSERAIIGGLKF